MITRRNAALKLSALAAMAICFIAQVPPAFGDSASTQSYTGTLANSESVFQTTVKTGPGDEVVLQSFEFGGGTNASGTTISAGGTAPEVAVFDSTGEILTDGMGNPYGTSIALANYPTFMGCSLAEAAAPVIGGTPQCGDVILVEQTCGCRCRQQTCVPRFPTPRQRGIGALSVKAPPNPLQFGTNH